MVDFDRIIDRRPWDSMKWNVPEGVLPMWVADMDFEAAPPIREALQDRLNHGIFGGGRGVMDGRWKRNG